MTDKKIGKVNLGDGTDKIFLMWESHWLTQWDNLDACDKKVLAALYWEQLSDKQKSEFTDSEYIDLQKVKAAKHAELMSDPVKMKKNFLQGAAPLIDEMLALANGTKKKTTKDSDSEAWAKREIWSVMKDIITRTENLAPMLDLKGKTIDDQINAILTNVSEGKITIADAKEYMALVSAGFNLQQLPKLMASLEALENK
ncbi:MAG: hypothetical protein JRJ00_00825 [Deltaproteobacteria bacterium]|nr:hypothetical protein [Deltaproteobacteria bacterium]